MNKKKIGIIVAAVVVVVAAAGGGAWYVWKNGLIGGKNNGDKVYVESVKSLSGMNSGAQNRFSGVVEPQDTWKINKNADKTVKEVFVKEGDPVEVGTPLFEYDSDEIKDKIAQAKLELEGIDNEVSDYNNQIKALTEERNSVPEEDKFQYTTQIQSLQTQIKQSEYSKESKQLEIGKLEESLNNAVVTSEIAGVIKSISESGMDQFTGEELPYMTVLATGDYRIKGTINEQNIWTLSEGQPVLIRSRIDEEKTWNGSISKIDTENEVTNNNNGGYVEVSSESGSTETATKYPFYIEPESMDGLMLGQHVYIELDVGQTEKKEGIWLYESYLVTEEEASYVWADNGNGRLEKRKVELGEYDDKLGMYEIKSGLKEDDLIAFPMAALYEGVPTVTDASEVDFESPMYKESQGEEGQTGEPVEGGEGLEDGMDEGAVDPEAEGTDGMEGMEGSEGTEGEGSPEEGGDLKIIEGGDGGSGEDFKTDMYEEVPEGSSGEPVGEIKNPQEAAGALQEGKESEVSE